MGFVVRKYTEMMLFPKLPFFIYKIFLYFKEVQYFYVVALLRMPSYATA